MSVRDRLALPSAPTTRRRLDAVGTVLVRALVGDRLGLVLCLSTLAFTALYWRVGIFITDTYTVANALVALSEGTLAVERAPFGTLEAPGMQIHEGTTYGRNYGQAAFALPFLWVLQAVATAADPGIAFASLWCLLVLALGVQVGRLLDRPSLGASVGAVVAVVLFGLNAAVAKSIDADLLPVAALQLSAMTATALAGTTLYRLFARVHDRRVGVAVGVATVFSTGVGFWASIPKRHVYVVALVCGVAYALYRSRTPTDDDAFLSATGFRGLAYALVGLLTWIHAGEGFLVFLALVVVDFPTAPSNDVRSLAVVGCAFALSLLPFFLTNYLIAGDPVSPPRLLSQFGERSPDGGFGDAGGSSGDGSGSSTDGGSSGSGWEPLTPIFAVFGALYTEVTWLTTRLFGEIEAGIRVLDTDLDHLNEIVLRGGYIDGVGAEDNNQAVYLTVVESAPIAGGLIAAAATVIAAVARLSHRARRTESVASSVRARLREYRIPAIAATDGFVVLVLLLFLFTYVTRLPIHAQVTVRYVLVAFPLATYGLARIPALRRVVSERGRLACWTYAAGVLVGTQLFYVVYAVREFGRGEAFQFHAVVGLAVAAAFAVCAVASVADDRADPLTAITGAIAAALGTNFVVLSGLVYFQYGPYALPLVDRLADLLAAA